MTHDPMIKFIDPELRDFALNFPKLMFSDETLPMIRQMESEYFSMVELPKNVSRNEIMVKSIKDEHQIRCLVYKPIGEGPFPIYLHFHGGGMVMGAPENSDERNVNLCSELNAVVVSVDYRLAPEHPYPAALEDAYSVLSHVSRNSSDLNIDRNRIAIGGESAGGGLAATLAILNRELGHYRICQQILVYPMLDPKTGLGSYLEEPELGHYCWTRAHNDFAWKAYVPVKDECNFIPANVDELVNLPPVWMPIGDKDLFLYEAREYTDRLRLAQVHVDYDEYPNAPHGFYITKTAKISQQFERKYIAVLKEAFAR